MITEMKKLELLLYHIEKEKFLESIREAGVIHVVASYEELSPLAEEIRSEIVHVDRVIRSLKALKVRQNSGSKTVDEILSLFERNAVDRTAILQKLEACLKEISALEPWGNFEPELLVKLKQSGIYTSFYEMTERQLSLLGDRSYEIVQQKGTLCRVVVFDQEKPVAIADLDPVQLPTRSLESLLSEKESCDSELQNLTELDNLVAAEISVLKSHRESLENELRFEQARISMNAMAKEKLLHLSGWFPVAKAEMVAAVLESFSCWYEISRPTKEDDVPVELCNRGFGKLFEPITKIFALPNYFELDPTPFFAPFYALFFGLCLGDIGYGFVLMTIGIIAAFKTQDQVRAIASLAAVLGFSTFVSGFFLNSCFGHALFQMVGAEDGWFTVGSGIAFLQPIPKNGTLIFPAMAFAVYLGIFQMMFAMGLKAVNKWRMHGKLFAIQPVAAILMTIACMVGVTKSNFLEMGTFTLGVFPLGSVLTSMDNQIVISLFWVGLVFMFLFNNPDKKLMIRLPLGLWEFYGFITGFIGDSLSYIRLFALGISGGLLAGAFNQIAVMPITVDGVIHWNSPLIIFTIVIMVAGHLTNFLLSMIGSFVHPLRLTFVEFYKNLDFKGGSKPYRPLARTEQIK